MKVKADLLLINADQLVTVKGNSKRPARGPSLGEPGIIAGGAVAVKDGLIAAVGSTVRVMGQVEMTAETVLIDARGTVVLPGLIDPHTHLLFAGSREDEFEMKIRGADYLEILAGGGGIHSTVHATRSAGEGELVVTGQRYLGEMLAAGTTTAEIKSGYGLTLKDELKQLRSIRALAERQPVELLPTFLGAHAIPEEYRSDPDEYVAHVVGEMLPAVARSGLAGCCDVFCEEGVFSIEQSRRILQEAHRLGFKLKLHADEIVSLGGAELAVELGALSADHLVAVSGRGVAALATSETVAVLLPATTFCLMKERYAPARQMIEAGVAVALASDFNPGSCPVNSLPVVMGIACRQLKMTPAEVVVAATINAAHALGCAADRGSLEAGKKADLVVFDAADYRSLPYRFGTNLVKQVIKSGKVVVGG